MKFLFLLFLIPNFVQASALVTRDEFNKIMNVSAVLNFHGNSADDALAESITNELDRLLNEQLAEVVIKDETYTVLFNLDYQLDHSKYPLTDSCAHNLIELRNRIKKNEQSYQAPGSRTALFIQEDSLSTLLKVFNVGMLIPKDQISGLSWENLVFTDEMACLGNGLPQEI